MPTSAAAARVLAAANLLTCLLLARPAGAFEFFDGRIAIHGYGEAQFRGTARDMSGNDDWDLTQWYNVLEVEIDLDIAPNGFGPFDLISGFVRLEARYDCIWNHACHMFPSVDVYGNNPGHFPYRYADARHSGFT